MSVHRPKRVTALAIVFMVFAVLGFGASAGFGTLIASERNSLLNGLLFNLRPDLLSLMPSESIPIWVFSNLIGVFSEMSSISTRYLALAIGALIFSGLYLVSGFGLLKMKKWGISPGFDNRNS